MLKYFTIKFTVYLLGSETNIWFLSGLAVTSLFYYLMDFDFALSNRHSDILNDSFASDFDEIE